MSKVVFIMRQVWFCVCNMLIVFVLFCSKESENDEVFFRPSQVGNFFFPISVLWALKWAFY